ncbi:hypothetical protein D3C72_1811280 [compost metagenome]
MRLRSRVGWSSASWIEKRLRRLSEATNWPCTWHERTRSWSITGVLEASDKSKPSFTACTMHGRLGRGSSSHICDFIANAWLRSCMIEEPSP